MTDVITPEKETPPQSVPIVEQPFHEIEAFGLKVKAVDDGIGAVVWVILAVAIGYIFKVAVDSVFGCVVDWYKHTRLK